jgi:hypothetical protein
VAIDTTCAKCSKPFAVKDKYAGYMVPCPDCQTPQAIPDPDACTGMEREFWRVVLYPLLVLTTLAWGAVAFGSSRSGSDPTSSPSTLWVAVCVLASALAISAPVKTPPRERR